MDFNRLLNEWKAGFYTSPVLLILEATTLFYILRHSKRDSLNKWFALYLLTDLIIVIITSFFLLFNFFTSSQKNLFFAISNTLIANIEIIIYYIFFSKVLPFKKIIFKLNYFAYIYTIISIPTVIYFSFKPFPDFLFIVNIVGCVELAFLLPPCILFYINLLKTDSPLDLPSRPSFWITTGIFFYSIVSIPFCLIYSYFIEIKYEYKNFFSAALYYFPFILNIFFILIAFKCKKALTT